MRPEASTRRWGAAVGLSLLLHALALSWWWGAARRPLHAMSGATFQAPAGRAPAMVWIATSPPLASAAASATPLAQLAGPQPATSVRTVPVHKKQAVAVPALAATVTAPPAAAPQAVACQALALGGGRPAPRSRRHQCAGAPAGAHCSAPTLDSRRRKQRRSGWGHAPDRAVRRRGHAGHAGATRCGGVLRGGALRQPAARHGCGTAHRVAAQLLLSSTGTACTVQGLLML